MALYTVRMLMLSSCWPGLYSVLHVHLLVIVQNKKFKIKYKIRKNISSRTISRISTPSWLSQYSDTCLNCKEPEFVSRQRQGIFLSSAVLRPTLGAHQASDLTVGWQSGRNVKLTFFTPISFRLTIRDATHNFPTHLHATLRDSKFRDHSKYFNVGPTF